MSQENVEIARKVIEAVQRGDWDVLAAHYDPDVSIRADPKWPEQRMYGREAAMSFVRNACEAWGLDTRIEEIVDLGDRLLVRIRWNTHARHTGIEGDLRYSELITYRDGRMILVEYFLDHEQALKAVGLAEEAKLVSEESTTPDLVERVRGIFEAASRRDWDVVISFHPPDSVWDASRFDVGTFEGPEAIRGLFEDWIDAYEDWHIELQEVIDLGNGVVFVVNRQKARLADSTAYLQGREAFVFEWVEGMIARVTAYPDIDEARAAAERLAEERG